MRANETGRLLAAGRPAYGLFVSSASPLLAELAGGLGFAWVLVDLQHGENNLGNLSPMLQAVSATAATPFVRVPVNDAMLIGRALDLGAYGVVVPLVNDAAAAEAAVQAAKYPPRGARSWGPIRGALYGGGDYFARADAETQLFVMLETAAAVERARAILAVPGVAGCFVGLNDLAISLGLPPEGGAGGASAARERSALPAPLEEALAAVLAACRETGAIPGIQLYDAAAANARVRQGFRFVGLGTEARLLRGAATALLAGLRDDG
jgi:4-hydroxy-2-oxoheptanedioate aldolase